MNMYICIWDEFVHICVFMWWFFLIQKKWIVLEKLRLSMLVRKIYDLENGCQPPILCQCYFWAASEEGRPSSEGLRTQTQPWDYCSGDWRLMIQTPYVNIKAGFSQRFICYSLIHPPTRRAGDLRLCSWCVMRIKHLWCWPEKRELLVKLRHVGKFCVLSRA